MPNSWKLVRLSNVALLQPGYAFKSKDYSSSGIKLLRGTNIVPGDTRWNDTVYLPLDLAEDFKSYELCEDDIVIAMDRPVISDGLKVTRIKQNDLPALLLQRVGRFRVDISVDYVFHFLNSPLFLSHIQDQATGTQLPHISKNDIESVLLPLPPINEQKAIVEYLNSVHKYASRVEESLEAYDSQFHVLNQSILSKAFRGELVPQDSNDEPASVLLERIRTEREKIEAAKKKKKRSTRKKAK